MSLKSSAAGPLSPEFPLLGLLAQSPAHGYELHGRLCQELGEIWTISLSQTYNILNRLEAQGFIDGEIQEQDKLPNRRSFHLTPAGEQRFDDWLRSPCGSSAKAIRVEFLTRLYFARQFDPPLVEPLLEAQTGEIQAGLARLEAQLAEVPASQPINRLGLELRIRQLASVLEWLGDCRTALKATAVDRLKTVHKGDDA